MIKSRSTSLLNLIVLTVCINLCVTISDIAPQVLHYFKLSDERMSGIYWVLLGINSTIGIIEFVILVLNKKCIRLIRSVLQQQRERFRNRRKTRSVHRLDSADALIEIRMIKQSTSDGGLLGQFFDNVTKEVEGS